MHCCRIKYSKVGQFFNMPGSVLTVS
uniref:Uncharacterized protein n=1 Tax=Anguilla anguilla TaxID=7936 RepID=A0A0E9UTK7_ANGAN